MAQGRPRTTPRQRKAPAPSVPRWTRGRLVTVLVLVWGQNQRGGVNTAAVAEAVGVSQRTVQRWLLGQNRWRAKVPPARLEQIRTLALPEAQTLRDERDKARYAREALQQMAIPHGRGVLPAWREQRWDEPHLVAVTELPLAGIRQVNLTRVTSRRGREEMQRRGEMLDFTIVPSRFAATLLVHELLDQVQPWRVYPRARRPRQGPTQSWLADAPLIDLDEIAVTHGWR